MSIVYDDEVTTFAKRAQLLQLTTSLINRYTNPSTLYCANGIRLTTPKPFLHPFFGVLNIYKVRDLALIYCILLQYE
jgi:hypothetical protein